jgi:deoxyribodipyrimidine photo-lyase
VDHETAAREAKRRISEVRKGETFRASANAVYLKLGSRKRSTAKAKSPDKQDQRQLPLL